MSRLLRGREFALVSGPGGGGRRGVRGGGL